MIIRLDRFPQGKLKALIMSYDDGSIHDRRLVEIFNEYCIKGTFHVNSGFLDKEGFITSDEINKLYSAHEVALHTANHINLSSLPIDVIASEIYEDRIALESKVKYPIKGLSYPYGSFNEILVNLLPSFGIEYAHSTRSNWLFSIPDNFLKWDATCHHRYHLLDYGQKFMKSESRDGMSLMKVWGHSYEFERDNNWGLIEGFCKLVANNDSIWYTTSRDFVIYMNAVKSLRFSAAGNMVHNISAISVWISVNGVPTEIESGKIVEL